MTGFADRQITDLESLIYKALVRLGKYKALEVPVLLGVDDRKDFIPQILAETLKRAIDTSDSSSLKQILQHLTQRTSAIQSSLPENAVRLVEDNGFSIRDQIAYLSLQRATENLKASCLDIKLPDGSPAVLLRCNKIDLSCLKELDDVLSKHFKDKKFCLDFTVEQGGQLDRDHEELAHVLSSEIFSKSSLTLRIEGDCLKNMEGEGRELKASPILAKFLEKASTVVFSANAIYDPWLVKAVTKFDNLRQIVFCGRTQAYAVLLPEVIGMVARNDLSSLVLQGVRIEPNCFLTIHKKFKSLKTLGLDTFICDVYEASDLAQCAQRTKIVLPNRVRSTPGTLFILNYLSTIYSDSVIQTGQFNSLQYSDINYN